MIVGLLLCATTALAAGVGIRTRVSEANGVVRVVVDVRDDEVVFGAPATGRVTVWLADAAIVADGRARRRAFAKQRLEAEKALAADAREPAVVTEVKTDLHEAAERWRGSEQLDWTEIASAVGKPAAAPASSRYELTPGGYRATLTIPLQGVLAPTGAAVSSLRYRIEVGDAEPSVASAKTTTKSGRLTLRPPWRLQLDEEQRIARQLAPDGRFELRSGAYVYVLPAYDSTGWTFDGACCTPNVTLPGPWTPFEPRNVSHLDTLRVYVGSEAVLLIAGARRARLRLSDAELLFQAWRDGAYYLLFLDNQPSRPGSPMSMCGGGSETSLVWMKLSPTLVARRQQSILVGSCWYNLDGDEEYQTDDHRVWGETDLVDMQTGAHTGHIAYSYDNQRPQRGLVTTRAPAP